jgi:hypothetical protein
MVSQWSAIIMKTRLRKKFAKKLVANWLGEVPIASGTNLIIFDDGYEVQSIGDDPRPPSLEAALSIFDYFGYKCIHVDMLPPVAGRLISPGDFQKAREEKQSRFLARQGQRLERRIAEYKQKYG